MKYLMLMDDGWRFEKQEILETLKRKGVDFDIVTHDPMTEDLLGGTYKVHRIPIHPLKKKPAYIFGMFFARELDTHIVRMNRKRQVRRLPLMGRLFHGFRNLLQRLHLKPFTYEQVLSRCYRNSTCFTKLLEPYDALIFTPVAAKDKRIIFEAHQLSKKIVSWVYSWDNPMKDNEFLTFPDLFLVWNKENQGDIETLFGIPKNRIAITGPPQFDYLLQQTQTTRSPDAKPYWLYTCSTGLVEHLPQEVALIEHLRKLLDDLGSPWPLWVRPYPFRLEMNAYERIKNRPGIKLLEFGRDEDGRILIDQNDVLERFYQIRDARGMINIGSTISLEASYTETPIIHMAYAPPFKAPKVDQLSEALKNDHLVHIDLADYPNVCKNDRELSQVLEDIMNGKTEAYRAYADKLQEFANPLKVKSCQETLADCLISWPASSG